MDEADIKRKVADEMRSLLPEDLFRPTVIVPEPTEADKRQRLLRFTVQVPVVDTETVRGLAESLFRKHLGMQSN